MTHFLIEVSEDSDAAAYKQIGDAVHRTGSHFATHAAWEHKNGICTGSMTAELRSRHEAIAIVPPNMRAHARVTEIVAGVAA